MPVLQTLLKSDNEMENLGIHITKAENCLCQENYVMFLIHTFQGSVCVINIPALKVSLCFIRTLKSLLCLNLKVVWL